MPPSSTRDQIIQQADTLFYQSGFNATSFADIAAAVGISRGNFYHHFRSKDDILDAVITRRIAATRAMLDGWQAAVGTPQARILCFIRLLMENRGQIMAHGCPVGTMTAELAKIEHAAQARAAAIFGLFRDWLTTQFQALGAGDAAQSRAMHLLVWSQGVAIMASAFRDETFIRREVAGIETWLAGLPEIASVS